MGLKSMMPASEIILKEKTVRNLLNMLFAHTAHTMILIQL